MPRRRSRAANVLLNVVGKQRLARIYRDLASMCVRLGARPDSASARRASAIPRPWRDIRTSGRSACAPLFHGLLAELEAEADVADEALTSIDRALDARAATGEHSVTDALLHRIRGDILLKARSREPRARRGSLPRRHRRRARAGRAQLRPAGGAEAGEALPIHRPPRGGPRGSRAGDRGLPALTTAMPGDCRGAGAADCTRGDRRGQGGGLRSGSG